jgi:hypothetical protein
VGSGTGALDDTPDLAIRGGELSFSFERSARTFYSTLPRDAPHQAALDGKTRLVTGLYRAGVVRGRLTGTFSIAGQHSPLAEFIGVRRCRFWETMESLLQSWEMAPIASGAWT